MGVGLRERKSSTRSVEIEMATRGWAHAQAEDVRLSGAR